jgi:ubiquinone/menaquinone biosynthesis C-methylase UbiE
MGPHVCPWWGGYFIDNWLRRRIHNPAKILAPFVKPEMTVMDFGCGMGMFSIAMAQLVGNAGRVIAVDLQQKMLDVLQKRAQKAGVLDRIRTHRCERDSIGFDEPTDFALAFYSAHEVPNLRRLLGEIHGSLRPQGRFMVVEPIGHVTANDFQAMLSLAEEIGLYEQERPPVHLSRAVILVKH